MALFNLSEEKLNRAFSRLLKLCQIKASKVTSHFEIEQLYTLVPLSEFESRRDLQVAGRSLFTRSLPIQDQEEFQKRAKISGFGFEAIEKNLRVQEWMRIEAPRLNLACLLDEKPCKDRLCGKICKWSLMTEEGRNLLDPTGDRFLTLVLRTAIVRSGHPELPGPFRILDTDCSWAFTLMQVLIADHLQLLLDEIEDVIQDQKLSSSDLLKTALPILEKEVQRQSSVGFLDKRTIFAFEGILTETELVQRSEKMLESWVKKKELEASLVADHFSEVREEIRLRQEQIQEFGWEAKAKVYEELICPLLETVL